MKTRPYTFNVRAQADGDYEISVRGIIGTYMNDDWTMSDTETDVLGELAKIPAGKKINVRVNSKGGNVQHGLGIYNSLSRRSGDVTTYNDGFACSAAALVMLAGSRRVCPTSSMMMIHCSAGGVDGATAVEMRSYAECLDTIDKLSAQTFAKVTGKKTEDEFAAMMAKTTWLTGQQAVEMGLATECQGEVEEDDDSDPATAKLELDIVAKYKSTPKDLLSRLTVKAQASVTPPTNNQPTKKSMKAIIAALVAAGHTLSAEATETDIIAVLNPVLAEGKRLKTEVETHATARKTRVTSLLATAVTDKVITEARQTSLLALGSRDAEGETAVAEQIADLRAAKVAPIARGATPARKAGEAGSNAIEARLEEIQAELGGRITAEQRSTLTAESLKLRGLDKLFTPATT